MDKFDLKRYLTENKLLKEEKINTNVYYVEEYNDFNQEAVPEYEIDDVEAMLSSNEKNHLYIKKGTKGHYEDGIFTTSKESDTRVKPEYVTEGKLNEVDDFDGEDNFEKNERLIQFIKSIRALRNDYIDDIIDNQEILDSIDTLSQLIQKEIK